MVDRKEDRVKGLSEGGKVLPFCPEGQRVPSRESEREGQESVSDVSLSDRRWYTTNVPALLQ